MGVELKRYMLPKDFVDPDHPDCPRDPNQAIRYRIDNGLTNGDFNIPNTKSLKILTGVAVADGLTAVLAYRVVNPDKITPELLDYAREKFVRGIQQALEFYEEEDVPRVMVEELVEEAQQADWTRDYPKDLHARWEAIKNPGSEVA